MPGSGIGVSADLKAAFAAANKDKTTSFLKLTMQAEEVKLAKASQTGKGFDWAAAQGELKSGEPCYIVMRTDAMDESWILCLFVPENSPVRSKMLYAATAGALKEGLGANKFGADYHISRLDECTTAEYGRASKESLAHEIMTNDELDKAEAELQAHKMIGDVKVAALVDMEIKTSEEAQAAIRGIGKGWSSAIFSLDVQTEIGELVNKGNLSPEDIAKAMPPKEPRFSIVRFPSEDPATGEKKETNVFIYYCPDGAKPRQKMFYSSVKSMMLKLCTNLGTECEKNIEVSDPKDITTPALLEELYPRKEVKKKFEKPKRPGKGKARFTGAKFAAGGAAAEAGADAEDAE